MKSFIVFAAIVACAFAFRIEFDGLDEDVPLSKNGLAALLAEYGGFVPMGGQGRIVGGDAVTVEQFPWIITLQRLGSHRCGGAIISTTRALTAAHCTVGIPGDGFSIRAGSTQSNAGGQLIPTSNFINHPQYSAQTLNNDVSVLILASALDTTWAGVSAIGRPVQGAGTPAGIPAAVAGWGSLSEGGAGTTSLRAVTVPVVTNADCNTALNGGITAQMICAGGIAGEDACQGDSGGPLTAGGELIGLVSWGIGCARPGLPGVYARTSSFTGWINEQLS